MEAKQDSGGPIEVMCDVGGALRFNFGCHSPHWAQLSDTMATHIRMVMDVKTIARFVSVSGAGQTITHWVHHTGDGDKTQAFMFTPERALLLRTKWKQHNLTLADITFHK